MSKIRWFTDKMAVEANVWEQLERTASMPFVHALAVMPDVHLGKGSTVGTVVATEGAIMPACVGVDIGCGMIAVRTSLKPEQVLPHARTIREGIERRIPVGIGPRGTNARISPSAKTRVEMLRTESDAKFDDPDYMNKRYPDWASQLGSLGGGNHFIEVCVGRPVIPGTLNSAHGVEDCFAEVWVILHSGSRAVGHKVASHWTNVAQKRARHFRYDGFLPDSDLAFLSSESVEYWDYLQEAYWCQRFAQMNREEMMNRVLTELSHTLCDNTSMWASHGLGVHDIELERINCHHNYISAEFHEGKKLTITRKGAILASEGARGLIPGSMGDCSYVVTGRGGKGSFCSAPHGAGRRMSRTAARAAFKVEDVAADLAAKGIEARMREAIVDEAPGAYKNIDTVMEEARELVQPTHVLRQIISVKGD